MGSIELESVGEAEKLLRSYDAETESWGFPKKGDFWRAIQSAHAAGQLGSGREIAVIDGGFDLSYPRLARISHLKGRPAIKGAASTHHGTAVALLISEVAPEARLCLYNTTRWGSVRKSLVLEAIDAAVKTKVSVINLSLGRPSSKVGWLWRLKQRINPKPAHCDLCSAVDGVALTEKLLIGAAGNSVGSAYCPSRSRAVIGIGFQSTKRTLVETQTGGVAETAKWSTPTFAQAYNPDYTLEQPEGVLGTSFATPLISGALALLDDLTEVRQTFSALPFSGVAMALHAMLSEDSSAEAVRRTRRAYLEALVLLPHRHAAGETGDPCLLCSLFVQNLYVNAGLFFQSAGDLSMAENLLGVACWLAPWSPHARSGRASVLQIKARQIYRETRDKDKAKALLLRAESEFEAANRLDPTNNAIACGLGEVRQSLLFLE